MLSTVVATLVKVVSVLLVVNIVRQLFYLVVPTSRLAKRRRFTLTQYHVIMKRAGWRCEHHNLLYGRCRFTSNLQADHVHPHARQGQTEVANGQALCTLHNALKWAWVPSFFATWNLERRRRKYFPAWAEVGIIRYGDRKSERKSAKTSTLTRATGGRKRRRTW